MRLVVAPVASRLYRPAPAYVLAAFVLVVVMFFATFDLFIVASLIAWLRRKGSGQPVFVLPAWSVDARAPSASRDVIGATVRCAGRATLLTTGRDPIVSAGWWTGADATELVLCSTFAVVPKTGTPVVVRHARAPRLFPSSAGAGVSAELLEIANASLFSVAAAKPFDDELTIREGDEVEVEGTALQVIDNSSHFEIDGVSSGLPSRAEGEEDPYRTALGEPAVLIEDAIVRKF